MNRLIAIGDIHGCADALQSLLKLIKPTPNDTLVILGDFIDRGPSSCDVTNQLIQLEEQCQLISILGNHEEMFLSVLDNRAPIEWWLQHGGRETLESYGYQGDLTCLPEKHIKFYRRLLPYFETNSHIFLHANYVVDEPMERQPAEALRWQSLHEHFPKCHSSGKTAIVGHTFQQSGDILDVGYLKCIDTGCCKGGWLTALNVMDDQIWQVDSAGSSRS